MKLTISKDTKAWETLRKQLMSLGKEELNVGWFATSYGPENDFLPHALIAQVQEEGSSSQNIPPRPFMRVGLKDYLKAGKADADFQKIIKTVLDGQQSFKALSAQGPRFVSHLQTVMNAWDTPPNAALTVELKGFNDPLRETGELIESVSYEVGRT